jgi:ssDNA-binding Zn-finger/Zn-ribbon topoisomerase 1
MEKKFTCPKCGMEVLRRESVNGHFFWGCTGFKKEGGGCDYHVDDIAGEPFLATCPECGSNLTRGKSKVTGNIFVACFNEEGHADKKAHFDFDLDGKPFLATCPECGSNLTRRKSKNTGNMYVACFNEEGHADKKAHFDFEFDGSPRQPRENQPKPNGTFFCPECNSSLNYTMISKGDNAGKMVFLCRNAEAHSDKKAHFFPDNKGTPEFQG